MEHSQMLLLVSLGTPSESLSHLQPCAVPISSTVIDNIAFLKASVLGRTLRVGNWGGTLSGWMLFVHS